MRPGTMWHKGETLLGHAQEQQEQSWHLKCRTSDAFVQKMKERALSFVTETFDRPICRKAVIEDPDGNYITIHVRHA